MASLVTQCDLQAGTWHTTSWIPANEAVVGRAIYLRGDAKQWTVVATYITVDRDAVKNVQHDAKDIWRATSGEKPIGHK